MSAVERVVELRDGAVKLRVASAGSGAPLVWFHSYYDVEPWSPFLDLLARRFTVYAPMHPGAPGSTGVESLEDVLDLTLVYDEMLDALGLETAHAGGHFFGGMVAAEIAAVFHRRIGKVVLASPLGLWLEETPNADLIILPVEDLLAAMWQDPQSEAARRWAASPDADPENAAAIASSLERRSAMAKFVWPIPDKGLDRRLHRLLAPTLLLWGDHDRANPRAYVDLWRTRLARPHVVTLPGGHMLIHESPDAAADAVARFLA